MNDPVSILAVDDDPGTLGLLVKILGAEGFQVRAADGGALALGALARSLPDLVVLDVHMPGLDGFEVCRRLQADPRTREIPVILMSAFSEPGEWRTGLAAGATDFITKPFSEVELVTRVKTLIRLVRSHEALRDKEQQYRNLADAGLALIWLSGLDKKCHYFNAPWMRFTGRTLDQEMGDGWAEGVHPEDFDRCLSTYVGAFDRREPFEMRYRLRHHTGEYRWITDMGTPNFDRQGQFVGYIGHCFDITEKLRYEEILARNDRLDSLGLLAGGIAHDFNNLLAGLFAYLGLAKAEAAGIPSAVRHLDKAMGAFDRAKDLTRQLLTFAKGGDPVRKTGNLGPRIRECVEFALSGSPVACDLRIADDLEPCDFDTNQIGQVMDNLIINALQAMPDGGRLTVEAANYPLREGQRPGLPAGNYLRIRVADTGVGIPAQDLPKIYDPFFTTKPNGNGLGLPTCHSILQRHHGAIDVESEPGRGTTFSLYLPAAEGLPEAEAPSGSRPHRGQGTFLVLEDEDMLLELDTECLEALGYTVTGIRDGAQVPELLAAWQARGVVPKAALLDLTVPGGLGGKDVVEMLHQAFPDLPVLATSGYSEDPIMARPQEFGFSGRLRKPYLREDLVDALNSLSPPPPGSPS